MSESSQQRTSPFIMFKHCKRRLSGSVEDSGV
jgi:hypothetical protein